MAMNAAGVRRQGLFDPKTINFGGSLNSSFNKVMVDVASKNLVTWDVDIVKFE